jgi:hypothetical protein
VLFAVDLLLIVICSIPPADISIILFSLYQKSVRRLEGELASTQNYLASQTDKIALTDALLTKTKVELMDAVKERDHQMTALANLLALG